MARTFHRGERLTAVSQINVTPMIDMAFALLIIFMITTPLLEQTIPLQLPSENASSAPVPREISFQTISITQEGVYYWSQEEVTFEELTSRIEILAEHHDPPVIHLRGDFRLQYQKVIEVMDLLKQNELTRISLDTRVK